MKMIILSSGILPKMEGDPDNFYNYYWTRFEDLKKLHLNSFAFCYLLFVPSEKRIAILFT